MAYNYEIDFFLDGVSAKENGIIMQNEPTFSPVEANIETFEIPGRTGALHVYDNTYKDRTVTISCYCIGYDDNRDNEDYTGAGVYSAIRTAESFLFPPTTGASVTAFRKLRFTPWLSSDHYYRAYLINGLDVQARLCTLTPFTLTFTIYPFPLME